MVWGNLCDFILVKIRAMNEVVRSRKDSVNLFNEENRLRVGCQSALALASIFNAESGQKKKQKSPKLISVEYKSLRYLNRLLLIEYKKTRFYFAESQN